MRTPTMAGFLLVLAFSTGAIGLDVEYSAAPLADAIRLLQERESEVLPNVVFDPEVDPQRPVTVFLEGTPAGAVFACLVDQAGYDFRREPHAIVVVSAGQGELTRRPSAAPSPMAEVARACHIGQVEFVDTPLSDVLRYLAVRGAEVHPEGRPLNLVLSREVDAELPVFLQLREVSLAEVLRQIAQLTGVEIRPEAWAVFIDPPGARARRADLARSRPAARSEDQAPPHTPRRSRQNPLGTPPRDPRSPVHPDYVASTDPDLRKRSNALNNVYRWKNGKWTFVRYGGADPRQPGLDDNGRRLLAPTLDAHRGKK